MTTKFVLIPTRSIEDSLRVSTQSLFNHGYQPVILVAEIPDVAVSLSAVTLKKRGNTFDSWINQGMDYTLSVCSDPRVVILNDDIVISPELLEPFFQELETHDLVYMDQRGDMVTPAPLTPQLFGMLPTTMRLPEPEGLALWWWNTDDMYHQAVADGKRIQVIPEPPYSHVSVNDAFEDGWRYAPEFLWSMQADHDYFWEKWHHLDPEHTGCYLSFWPQALPADQTHRTEWT